MGTFLILHSLSKQKSPVISNMYAHTLTDTHACVYEHKNTYTHHTHAQMQTHMLKHTYMHTQSHTPHTYRHSCIYSPCHTHFEFKMALANILLQTEPAAGGSFSYTCVILSRDSIVSGQSEACPQRNLALEEKMLQEPRAICPPLHSDSSCPETLFLMADSPALRAADSTEDTPGL